MEGAEEGSTGVGGSEKERDGKFSPVKAREASESGRGDDPGGEASASRAGGWGSGRAEGQTWSLNREIVKTSRHETQETQPMEVRSKGEFSSRNLSAVECADLR